MYKLIKRAIGEMHLGWRRSTNPDDVMYAPLMGLQDLDRIGTRHVEAPPDGDPGSRPVHLPNAI